MTFRYYTLIYDDIKSKLSSIVHFAFKGGDKTFISLSNNGPAYWGKTKGGLGFSKTSFKTAINHLIANCYFYVGNATINWCLAFQWESTDPATFWANIFFTFILRRIHVITNYF